MNWFTVTLVIDLRGTTDLGGRDIKCTDSHELIIRVTAIGAGTIGC